MSRRQPAGARIASAWLIGIVLVFSLVAFLSCLAAAQLTTADTGQRLLRRATLVIVDLDAIMPSLTDGVHQAAAEGNGPDVAVPDYPIVVLVRREQAATIGESELRARIVDVSAHKIYDNGMSVWTSADDKAFQDIGRFTKPGAVRYGLGLVHDSTHTAFVIATVFFGIVSGVLAALLMLLLRGAYTRMAALGSAILISSLTCLAAAVAVRFAFRNSDSRDPFTKGLLSIGVDAMSVPIRDYLVLTFLGIIVAGLGAGLMWWESSRREPPPAIGAPTGV